MYFQTWFVNNRRRLNRKLSLKTVPTSTERGQSPPLAPPQVAVCLPTQTTPTVPMQPRSTSNMSPSRVRLPWHRKLYDPVSRRIHRHNKCVSLSLSHNAECNLCTSTHTGRSNIQTVTFTMTTTSVTTAPPTFVTTAHDQRMSVCNSKCLHEHVPNGFSD